MLVVIVDIVSDSSNQCRHILERTSTDAFDGKLGEPTLDNVHPRTGCWNEVQMEPWMPFEPRLYAGMLVGAVIVYNQMQVEEGYISLPTTPGLGLEINEVALKNYPFQEFPVRKW